MEHTSSYKLFYVTWFCLLFLSPPLVSSQLSNHYYDRRCPVDIFRIVGQGVQDAMQDDRSIAASLLRLHFHDCFVNGCDASVLLDGTNGEKNASPNKGSARGYGLIDDIKSELEQACPSTVSCADILTLAAAAAVFYSGGPQWPVELGRRDGFSASKDEAEKLPSPFEPLDNIIAKFTAKGLDLKDLVVLSGAHTIGSAQCFTFKSRLYNFNGSGKPDPTLGSSFLSKLQQTCPNQADSDTKRTPLEPVSPARFDNFYFKRLVNNNGLLQSDQALMSDDRTASMVISYSRSQSLFFDDFGESMVRLARTGVRTAPRGEIRENCRTLNY